MMKRRDFMGWVGFGLLGSSLPVAIAACSTDSTSEVSPTLTEEADPYEVVGQVSQFNEHSEILYESASLGKVLLVRSADSPDLIYAVEPTCPHAGCQVDWNAVQGLFVCPCHQSKFTSSGKVSAGPALQPLGQFDVKVEGGSILVKKVG